MDRFSLRHNLCGLGAVEVQNMGRFIHRVTAFCALAVVASVLNVRGAKDPRQRPRELLQSCLGRLRLAANPIRFGGELIFFEVVFPKSVCSFKQFVFSK